MTVIKKTFLLLFIPFLLISCAGTDSGAQQNSAEAQVQVSAPPADAEYRNVSLSPRQRAEDLLSYMTLDEKIGQMIQIDRSFLQQQTHVAEFALGSLLSGGGSAPANNSPQGWADMIDGFQDIALSTRLSIPLLYGIDAVHGNNNLIGATIFPHNIGLGAAGDSDLVERIARAVSLETVAIGVNWNFAPTVAVPQDIRWGRSYEGFGEDTELVSRLGAAAVRGYQGSGGLSDPASGLGLPHTLLATLKHFIGDGGTQGGVDQGNVVMPMEEIRRLFLPPYVEGLAAGAASVMASFNSIDGIKVHGSRDVLDGLLRNELGFDGLLVSDWAAVKQLPGSELQQMEAALLAGIDMIMVPDDYRGTIRNIKALVISGRIEESLIDRAVLRILEVKFALGLFENPYAKREFIPSIGSDEHRNLAREAVSRSLVLLENRGDILPISSDSDTVLMLAGAGSHDIGMQSGGWTLSWQGFRGNQIPGTSILEAFQAEADQGSLRILHRPNGQLRDGDPTPDVVLVVLGEEPYAEMMGDSQSPGISSAQLEVLQKAAGLEIPLITLLLTGRPVDLRPIAPLSDALVAAWLPGTEGAGISDVLLGKVPFSGTLSYRWPEDTSLLPLDGQGTANVRYPLGYGLEY